MKTLNLVNSENSEIKYKPQKFPDGQQNIIIDEKSIYRTIDGEPVIGFFDSIQIKTRLNNWKDLELITCAVACLRGIDRDMEIHLYAPYVVGARSDRKFEEGGNNYLKDVICPAINDFKFKTVTVLDPHSDCLEMGIKGFRKESNEMLVRFAAREIYKDTKGSFISNAILISPDAGASKKIYKLAEQIGHKGEIITCSKDRDKDGKLTKTIVPLTKTTLGKDMIIIDDICDGGATFINIAKEIKKQFGDLYTGKIYLIVTHGIFSKGFDELSQYFDDIYCTNSYKDIQSMGTSRHMKFVKQLNVF